MVTHIKCAGCPTGQLARLIDLALGRDKEVMVIINNKAEGSSPLSVIELIRAIQRRRRG